MKRTLQLFATGLAAVSLVACGGDGSAETETKSTAAKSDAAAVPATADAATEGAKVYKVKSGIVEMTLDMMGPQKQTLYFDDYGARQAIVTSIEMMGQKSETISIIADGYNISYDPAKKEGTKIRSVTGTAAGGVPNLDALTDEVKERYKLKEIDAQTIAGKEAQGYEMEAMGMPMKVWIWEGIPMRTEVSLGGEKPMVTTVENIQTDVEVPADRFVVPADIKLTEK